jgi:GT2 family glycosyltransferase
MSRHYFKPDSPQVSILIIREPFDNRIKDLLANIRSNTYPHIEVIVINLGISEMEVKDLYEHFPYLVQVNLNSHSEKEFALNEGIKIAKGDYLLFLHHVHEINTTFVEQLVSAAKKSARIVMVSPQVRHYSQKDISLFRASEVPKTLGGYLDYSSYHARLSMNQDQPSYAQFACSDVFLVSMDFLHRLEEDKKGSFFLLDELDMAETVHKHRLKIYYEPFAIAYIDYLEEAKLDAESVYLKTRNRLASIRKHREGWVLLGILMLFSVSYVPKHTFHHLIQMRPDHILAFYRGVFWNIFHSAKAGGIFSRFKWK